MCVKVPESKVSKRFEAKVNDQDDIDSAVDEFVSSVFFCSAATTDCVSETSIVP